MGRGRQDGRSETAAQKIFPKSFSKSFSEEISMTENQSLLPKLQRLELFFDRLRAKESAVDHDAAMALLSNTLNGVEDEFSGVAYNPEEPGTDGRMYPPNERFRYPIWERVGVRCYRQVAHATFVAENGAVEIRARTRGELGRIIFEKPGRDGRRVSDYDSTE
jgi:hypothetical protein